MGAAFNGKCFADTQSAADAFFSSAAPVLTPGANTYQAWFEKVSGQWQLKRQTIDSTGVITYTGQTLAVTPEFSSCDPMEYLNDGLSVGWLLSALLLSSWGMLQLKRLIR